MQQFQNILQPALKTFITLTLLYMVMSCSDEEQSNFQQLKGEWNLVNVTCECSPADLEKGQHIWNFNVENSTVSVKNEVEKPLQILDTDTYQFDLTSTTIMLKSVTYDYYFEEEKLFLADHPEADGPLMEFVR